MVGLLGPEVRFLPSGVNAQVRKQVKERSGGFCEGYWLPPLSSTWTRCTSRSVQVHHKITRARGGELLDTWTIYHLADLCVRCHITAHRPVGLKLRLMLPGSVLTNKVTGKPVYTGSDPYLSSHFGAEEAS
jgi:5-methylcytosine-specific restriction endonuclease McrA